MNPLTDVAVVDYEDEQVAVIRHDARTLPLEDSTVDLIVTSPPYFALRSYRDGGEHYAGQIGSEDSPDLFLDALDECMVEWGRVLKPSGSVWINLGDKYAGSGGHNNSGVGADPERGPTTYNKSTNVGMQAVVERTKGYDGLRAKSLMGLPWRFAIRQIDNGWILRAEVVWDKPNGLPESVTDRVRRSHEQWFHFVKESRYFSGVDEIREPQKEPERNGQIERPQPSMSANPDTAGFGLDVDHTREYNPLGRLPGSVWSIPSEPLLIPDDTRAALDLPDHFAAFPQEWPRRIILGWSPTGICTECGEGRRPVVEALSGETKEVRKLSHGDATKWAARFRDICQAQAIDRATISEATGTSDMYSRWTTRGNQPEVPLPHQWEEIKAVAKVVVPDWMNEMVFRTVTVPVRCRTPRDVGGGIEQYSNDLGFNPAERGISGYACACPTPDAATTPAVVLDPFGGTGTVAGVARMLGRYGISNDLSASYNRLAVWRITQSGHFTKTEQRSWADRQGQLL